VNRVEMLLPSVFGAAVVAALSTRQGGVSSPPLGMNLSFHVGDDANAVRRNREMFFGAVGIGLEELAIPRQVHSARVVSITRPGIDAECDGFVTGAARVFLCVSFADCVPMLLHDPVRSVVAAVHAGWRGTVAGIAREALRVMQEEHRCEPATIRVYIGPAAATCCYRVGSEVASRFPPQFVREAEGSTYVDLKSANRHQLIDSGVSPAFIETSPLCTITEAHLLHSHRRDGTSAGRMMAVIGIPA
jgi:YfiH family protein